MDMKENLLHEHEEIMRNLEQAKRAGVGTIRGRSYLNAFRNDLIEHLEHEDNEVYPYLNRIAEVDPMVRTTLDVFAHGMQEITDEVNRFFSLLDEGADSFTLSRAFGAMYARLRERMRKEEKALYPALEHKHEHAQ